MVRRRGGGKSARERQTITVRRLKDHAADAGSGQTALAERCIEEGIRQDEHPPIDFREGAAGRRPALLGSRLDVAEAIETIRQRERWRWGREALTMPCQPNGAYRVPVTADLGRTGMNRRASCLSVIALALMAAFAATASAGTPVIPKLGLYYGQVAGPPENGTVEVHETEVKVVKIGKGQGAQVSVSPFQPSSCSGDPMPGGFSVLEKSPIPIRKGRFKLDRTTHPRIAAGAGTATMRTVVSGTFKSPTKVVVKVLVNFSYSVQYPGQSEVKGTCTGKQTGIAKHQ